MSDFRLHYDIVVYQFLVDIEQKSDGLDQWVRIYSSFSLSKLQADKNDEKIYFWKFSWVYHVLIEAICFVSMLI